MKLLLLKESKKDNRALLVPNDVKELTSKKLEIYFESGIGSSCGFADTDYISAGANLVKDYKSKIDTYHIICTSGVINKSLLKKLKPEQIIWSYSNPINQVKFLYNLMNCKSTLISLKTISWDSDSSIFSNIEQLKGKFAVSLAGLYLSKYTKDGLGKVLGKVNNFSSTVFVIGGAKFAGEAIIKSSLSLGSDVVVFDYDQQVVDSIKNNHQYQTLCSLNKCTISSFKYDFEKLFSMLRQADVVFCCSDNPNTKTHEIFNEKMISTMRKGTVFVNLASDYGFASETERHSTKVKKSTFTTAGIIHFNVADIERYYPETFSTLISSLNTMYLETVMDNTFDLATNPQIAPAVITHKGYLTNETIAKALSLKSTKLKDIK